MESKVESKWLMLGTKAPNLKEYVGFIYVITNKLNQRLYVGKKLFWFKKGKKLVESDWRTYWGSCNELKADIAKYGKKNFTRQIISLHKTRFEWSYNEVREQVERKVLYDPRYYNQLIRCRLKAPKKGEWK